jgi:hypothetical protein
MNSFKTFQGGDVHQTLGVSTGPHRDHCSTDFPLGQVYGVFPHPERGHPGGHYRGLADAAGPCAADLPATKTQKPERRIGEIGWISFC